MRLTDAQRFGEGLAGLVEALQANEGQRHQVEAVRQTLPSSACAARRISSARVCRASASFELAPVQSNQPEVVQRYARFRGDRAPALLL